MSKYFFNGSFVYGIQYSRDCGWPRRPWPNAGRRKQKKRPKNHLFFFKKIKFTPKKSSSFAKILGEQLFRTWEFPRSGSKAKNGEKRKKERLNNGQATHGARKHAWRTQAAWANNLWVVCLKGTLWLNKNLLMVISSQHKRCKPPMRWWPATANWCLFSIQY